MITNFQNIFKNTQKLNSKFQRFEKLKSFMYNWKNLILIKIMKMK